MDLGVKIKMLRKKNKDTLQELAKKINFNYSNLSKIERGDRKVSLEIVEAIARVYDVSVSYLVDDPVELSDIEKSLMRELDLNDDDLIDKYNLTVDGKTVTRDELKKMLAIIRALKQD